MICKICNKDFTKLTQHLMYSHKDISYQNYYDTYLKKDLEGKCKICNKPTRFISITSGYLLKCDKCIKSYKILSDSYKIQQNKLKNGIQCAICKEYLLGVQALSNHLSQKHHIKDKKEYFDLYRKGNTDVCPTCGNKTKYIDFTKGYETYCSLHCNPKYKNITIYNCKICNEEFTMNTLSKHLKYIHKLNAKEYYNKYYLKNNENICPVCGKENKFFNIANGYSSHCSCKCAQKDQNVRQKYKNTCLDIYGTENSSQNNKVKEKIKNTNRKKYGYDCILNKPEIKNKAHSDEAKNKVKQTKLKKYGNSNFNNREKSKYTCIEKYGTTNLMTVPEIKEKIKNTNLKKYGVDHPWKNNKIRDKIKQTNLNKYGNEIYWASEYGKNKIKEILLNKYGVEYISQVPEIKQKIQQNQKNTHNGRLAWNTEKQIQSAKESRIINYQIDNTLNNEDL